MSQAPLRRKPWHAVFLALLCSLWVLPASAGPIILGGDDLTDHGSATSIGVGNAQGWLYIQRAITNILSPGSNITRSGHIPGRIAALGAAPSGALSGDAGAAIGSAAAAAGFTVDYYDGAAAINAFFAGLANNTVPNPAMLWIAGTGAANNLDSAEGAALTANAAAISAFVGSGGGLMAHGSGVDAYGWLTALLPGLTEDPACTTNGVLTPAGVAAFPGLTNSDISAGPCHSSFSGTLGGLQVLANDTNGLHFILGGGAGTTLVAADIGPIPTLSEWGMIILSSLLALGTIITLRRQRQ
ncbi:MAG: IPTL-CTERM sorting domain-containing protein [Betaproteobacteria bacterium]|nr:IPTL-CTERM sorting domain-containing protein [Betaproteobacteria bacterium]